MAKTTPRAVVLLNNEPDTKHFAKPKTTDGANGGVLSLKPKGELRMTGEEYEAAFPPESAAQRALETYIKQDRVKLIAA